MKLKDLKTGDRVTYRGSDVCLVQGREYVVTIRGHKTYVVCKEGQHDLWEVTEVGDLVDWESSAPLTPFEAAVRAYIQSEQSK